MATNKTVIIIIKNADLFWKCSKQTWVCQVTCHDLFALNAVNKLLYIAQFSS